MSKFWRWITPLAAVGALTAGALLTAGAVPAEAASQSGYSVTIGATGSAVGAVHGKIDGYALVEYKTARHDNGTISGSVSDALSGDTVTLLAKPFKARSFTATRQTSTVSAAGTATYSFSVTPSLATSYEVQVSTGTTVDKTSASVTVYVTPGARVGKARIKCSSASSCTEKISSDTLLPASAYRTEVAKHVYFYLAAFASLRHLPKWLYISKASSASKPKRINAGEFEETLTWRISLAHGEKYWIPDACSKDTETRDGLGLPGHHGCGAKKVRATSAYLG
jgi:hypothetical protein